MILKKITLAQQVKKRLQPFSQFIAVVSLIALAFTLGVNATNKQWISAQIADDALHAFDALFTDPWQTFHSTAKQTITINALEKDSNPLYKIVHFTSATSQAVTVINAEGKLIYEWPIDWFTLWPHPQHLSYFRTPKSKPGALIHGAEILADGSLIFNFEYLGMVKLNSCGKVLWRLPEQTHHSINIADDGSIWAPANEVRRGKALKHDLHQPYYVEPFILHISANGKIIEKKSVMDLLIANHLTGSLYLSSTDNNLPIVRGDTLHLNDIEVFPNTMKEGFFKHGDMMISLRNINAILIFDSKTWKLKHSIFNLTTRQHDPDFISGDSISVFDNNNHFSHNNEAFSRLLTITIPDNIVTEIFTGTTTTPFFSAILGKQQLLDNGNWLLTESRGGRVIEINAEKKVVWEFNNLIKPFESAIIQEAQQLDKSMDISFFNKLKQQCAH